MSAKSSTLLIALAAVCVLLGTGCRRQRIADSGAQATHRTERTMHHDRSHKGGRITVPMRKQDGVYLVKAAINGVDMDFIFDTGASIVSISSLEATFLYKQGKLTDNDIKGTGQFVDATGNVTPSAIVNLRDVTIGGTTIHNVQASVANNQAAPLLLGQTVLSRFGRMTVDYDHMQIIFE